MRIGRFNHRVPPSPGTAGRPGVVACSPMEPDVTPPWTLGGEWIVAAVDKPEGWPRPPRPLRPVPGPLVLVAGRYHHSPVGPYTELAVGHPVRVGLRLALHVSLMVVDSTESRRQGRELWGFPKDVATLDWRVDGARRTLRWVERGVEVSATAGRLALPTPIPLRGLQWRDDGPVVVRGRLLAWVHPGHVDVSVGDDDELLAPLAGRHRGAVLSGMSLVVGPATPVRSLVPAGLRALLTPPVPSPMPEG